MYVVAIATVGFSLVYVLLQPVLLQIPEKVAFNNMTWSDSTNLSTYVYSMECFYIYVEGKLRSTINIHSTVVCLLKR